MDTPIQVAGIRFRSRGLTNMARRSSEILSLTAIAGDLTLPPPVLLSGLLENDPRAMVEAACRFLTDDRLTSNWLVSQKLLRRAVAHGTPAACGLLGALQCEAHHFVSSRSVAAGLENLHRAAKAGVEMAARQFIAISFERRTPTNIPLARSLIKQFCRRGCAWAHYEAGVLLSEGPKGSRSAIKAFQHFRYAADAGDVDGAFNCGLQLLLGDGCHRDSALASKYLSAAADGGIAAACYEMGLLWAECGTDGDWTAYAADERLTRASEYFRRGAALGDHLAQLRYANLLFKGSGVRRNAARAIEMASLSAIQGNRDAAEWLSTNAEPAHKYGVSCGALLLLASGSLGNQGMWWIGRGSQNEL